MVLCAICLLLKIQTQTTTHGVIDLPAWHLQVSLSIQKCPSKNNEKLEFPKHFTSNRTIAFLNYAYPKINIP